MQISDYFNDNEKLKKIYYVESEDDFLREEFKNKFIKKFIPEEIRGFNLSLVKSGDRYIERLKTVLNTPPVGYEKRFILSEVDSGSDFNKKEIEKIGQIIASIPESSVFLFFNSDSIDKRKKLYRVIKKEGVFFELQTPKYRELDHWINEQFRAHNKSIDSQAVKTLEDMFNNQLDILKSEIEKIITRFPEKNKIKFGDIREVISRDRLIEDREIFDFLDLIGEKKTARALLSLKDMINRGAYPLYLLTMLANHIRLLMEVKFYSRYTTNHKKIAEKLNKHPYPVKKALQRSKNFTQHELENILEEILQANYNFVTGYYPDQNMAVEMIIMKAIIL
ncbi:MULTISPECIES: DNA polymerase III subunit delta [unclassified Halanaerobium]|uniref:DNA polymerase III subunit delta n=1 Tax=unclassified Halanaerobium TaxID=2641197 RepID=UPI000DF3AFEA|nr:MULTISPECIES: DNA polymerase III subunit delta [unclassified Halanaerobium]RCW45407.1 DNA polymerase III delta subunit [Halanaerobium sp. MA284_MarDTE_T2]RCW82585.1 DNA polymerase III delta subunit [Halanaerobium sp. DL-01]